MAGSDKFLPRRKFLGLLATGGAVAGAAALTEAAGAAPDAAPRVTETRADKRRARYHVTDNVTAYYHVNRYPARKA